MKKYIYLLFTCLIGFSSCEKYLDLPPKNTIVTESLPEIKSVMSAYLFHLTSIDGQNIRFNGSKIAFPVHRNMLVDCCLYGDDFDMSVFMKSTYASRYYDDEYYAAVNWKSEGFADRTWREFYATIGYLNEVVASLDDLTDQSSVEFQQVRAEAIVYRSYCIFKLLQLFAPYENDELGIPLVLDPQVIIGGKRLTQIEIYKQVIDDLTTVLDYKIEATDWNVFYSKPIVNLLLSKVYWYKAGSGAKENDDWSKAAQYSAELVNNFDLISRSTDYTTMYNPRNTGVFKNDKLSLLSIFSKKSKASNLAAPFGTSSSNRQHAAEDLYEMYDADDIRLSAFFGSNMTIKKWNYGYFVREYTHMFRIADAFLVNAEANFRIGNTDQAKLVLEQFKQSRIPSFTTYTSDDLLGEILNERRKEFCYEFEHRWVDMKRLGLSVTRFGKAEDSNELIEYKLEGDDYRYALPIPVNSELKYNNIIQNPGWN